MMKWLFYISIIFSISTANAQLGKYEYAAEYWRAHYEPFSKEPYGGFMLHALLENKFGTPKYAVLPREHNDLNYGQEDQLYVLFTYGVYWRESDFQAIKDMAYRGNDIVIIAEELPYDVTYELTGYDFDLKIADKLTIEYAHGSFDEHWQLDLVYYSNFDSFPYEYHEIPVIADDVNFLSKTDRGTAVLVEIEYGDGHIYLCSTPMLFSNLYLKTPEGINHFNWFFNRFEDKQLVFDYGSQTPTQIKNKKPRNNEDGAQGSVLEHVLDHKSLLWAYVILMLMGLFYVIFKGKRRQSIVPLLASDENSSKEFVETVSELYLSKRQHRKLALQKGRIFLHFVRHKYYLTGKISDTDFQEHVRIKSGVDANLINRIFNSFKKADQSKVFSLAELTALHQDIEEFYQNCN